MANKRISRHCGFLNAYVGITMDYEKDEADRRTCEGSGCENSKCYLSKSFVGNRSDGKDFLDYPKK